MEQSPLREGSSPSVNTLLFADREGSQQPAIGPYPRPNESNPNHCFRIIHFAMKPYRAISRVRLLL